MRGRPRHPWPWWIGGIGFMVAELVIRCAMRLRGDASVYGGRG
ncbi:MAG TPA: hypothetical protein VMF70_01010 [Gemmatimonadales bacterium]|nr:hypothetical protein [Gemmatimonadales bacterium]